MILKHSSLATFILISLQICAQNIKEGYFPLEYGNPDLGPCIALSTVMNDRSDLVYIFKTFEGFGISIVDSNFYSVITRHYVSDKIKIVDIYMTVVSENGDIVIAGIAEGNNILVTKLTKFGDIIWSKIYFNQLTFDLNALSINKFNEILIGCLADYKKPTQSYFTLVIDNDGKVIKAENIELSIRNFYSAYCSVTSLDNSFILVGSGPRVNSLFSLWLLKVNRRGNIDWSRLFIPSLQNSTNYGAFGVSIEALGNDKYMVMGRYGDDLRGANPYPAEMSGLMVEINGSGDILSSNKLQLSDPVQCNPVDLLVNNGHIYLVGSRIYTHLGEGLFIAKYDDANKISFAKYWNENLRYPRLESYKDNILLTGYATRNNRKYQYFNKTTIENFDICKGSEITGKFLPIQLTEVSHSFNIKSGVNQNEVLFIPTEPPCYFVSSTNCKKENGINFQEVNFSRYFQIDTMLKYCKGNFVLFNNKMYNNAGLFFDTTDLKSGKCDTIFKIFIFEIKSDSVRLEQSLCYGDTLLINGSSYYTPGRYFISNKDHLDCDSITILDIYFSNTKYSTHSYKICQGDSFYLKDTYYTNSISLNDTLISENGCDSVIEYQITVQPFGQRNQNFFICPDDSVNVGSKFYSIPGSYTDTIQNIGQCDSIIHTNIFHLKQTNTSSILHLCDGDSVFINGRFYFQEGTYNFRFKTNFDCDSIVNLRIIHQSISNFQLDTILCEGEYFQISNQNISEPGTYKLYLKNINHCDSIIDARVDFKTCFEIYIPNAFSPNGDHNNDEFKIYHEGVSEIKIEIYDRWGELVYSSNSVSNAWDGKYKDKECMVGVYAYLIRGRFSNNKEFLYKGNITLLR